MESSSPYFEAARRPLLPLPPAVREEIPPSVSPPGLIDGRHKFTFVLDLAVSRQLDILVMLQGGDRSGYVNALLKRSLAHVPLDLGGLVS